MFLDILLSILQACFIPGFILWLALNRKEKDPDLLMLPVFSFGLSLVINYLVVTTLAYFHLYTRAALLVFISIELLILITIFVSGKAAYGKTDIRKSIQEFRDGLLMLWNAKSSFYGMMRFSLLLLAFLLFTGLIIITIGNTGEVFQEWDAIFSWNKWAVDFYENSMPYSTYHYPQLIPANWSVVYVLCKYPLQFVPKSIMHLFLILPVYALIISGIRHNKAFLFFSVFFLYLGLDGEALYWQDGFVDVALAYFSVMVFICLIQLQDQASEIIKKKYIVISILFVLGSAVTKQGGLFLIPVYAVVLMILSKGYFRWSAEKVLKTASLVIVLACIIVLPYYLWAEKMISEGLAASEVGYVTHDIFKGASLPERFIDAINLFSGIFSIKEIFFISMVFFVLSFTKKTFALLNLFLVIPFFMIWALYFSYDLRNSSLIIPYIALSIGVGLDIFLRKLPVDRLKSISLRIPRVNSGIFTVRFIGITMLLLISVSILFVIAKTGRERMITSQTFRLKLLGDPGVNQRLYSYDSLNPITSKIISDYAYLMILPDLDQHLVYCNIQSLKQSDKVFQDNTAGYILYSPARYETCPPFIRENIDAGLYKEIFNYNGYSFIKIN